MFSDTKLIRLLKFVHILQKRSIVSADDFEADKESLVRMLEDFRKDNASRRLVSLQGGSLYPLNQASQR